MFFPPPGPEPPDDHADRPLTFRISWLRPWLLAVTLMTAATVLLLLAAGGGGTSAGSDGVWIACALGLGICSVTVLMPIGLGVAALEWHVDADGIAGRDDWHAYGRVDWDEIASVSPRPIPGCPFVWVNARAKSRVIWLPLFLTEMGEFRMAISRWAPPANPLRRYLEGRGLKLPGPPRQG